MPAVKKSAAKKAPAKKAASSTVRIATFNVENLFARYRFRSGFEPSADDGFTINNLAFDIYNETEKQITARAIKAVNADIIVLQEVESLPVLDRFFSSYLGGTMYRHRLLIDGNDPRYIDVAVLSRFPITSAKTYRHLRTPAGNSDLFSRDCLEVDLEVNGRSLTLYANHLKSMMEGRAESAPRRQLQAETVAQIVDARWKPLQYQGNFIVLGDMNDYPAEQAADGHTSLKALLDHPELVNVLNRLDTSDQWTHYWAGGNEYHQIDFLLLSKTLAALNATVKPQVYRAGLPFRASRYGGERLDMVGEDNPKASDHCPVFMDIQLG
jgi:endonuclease/exonuclease/phosphatase family metal-dependent hydrolase